MCLAGPLFGEGGGGERDSCNNIRLRIAFQVVLWFKGVQRRIEPNSEGVLIGSVVWREVSDFGEPFLNSPVKFTNCFTVFWRRG